MTKLYHITMKPIEIGGRNYSYEYIAEKLYVYNTFGNASIVGVWKVHYSDGGVSGDWVDKAYENFVILTRSCEIASVRPVITTRSNQNPLPKGFQYA